MSVKGTGDAISILVYVGLFGKQFDGCFRVNINQSYRQL